MKPLLLILLLCTPVKAALPDTIIDVGTREAAEYLDAKISSLEVLTSTYSNSTNGFINLPGGMVMQWGTVDSATYNKGTNTTKAISFIKTFSEIYSFSLQMGTKNIGASISISGTGSTTGIDVNFNNSGSATITTTIKWIAIGKI